MVGLEAGTNSAWRLSAKDCFVCTSLGAPVVEVEDKGPIREMAISLILGQEAKLCFPLATSARRSRVQVQAATAWKRVALEQAMQIMAQKRTSVLTPSG